MLFKCYLTVLLNSICIIALLLYLLNNMIKLNSFHLTQVGHFCVQHYQIESVVMKTLNVTKKNIFVLRHYKL